MAAARAQTGLVCDLFDQYERVAGISQSQLESLIGVTEFHRARTDTKMTPRPNGRR
jgi:hypothetical protein